MPSGMSLIPYKPNQGLYARSVAGGAMLLLNLFGSVRLVETLGLDEKFAFLGLPLPVNAVWGAVLFLTFSAVIAVFTFGLETGLAGLDSRTHGFIDLLVDTQGELQKVSWPTREELGRSTTVVLVCIVALGCFLYVVDLVVFFLMSRLGVLPK